MARRILMLDSPERELDEVGRAFEHAAGAGSELIVATDVEHFLELVKTARADLVLVDQELGDGDTPGLDALARLRAIDPRVPVVVVAASGDVDAAARAVDAGANDFLVRAGRLDRRVATELSKVRKLLKLIDENRELTVRNRELQKAARMQPPIVGSSPEIGAVTAVIERVAKVPRPVLVLGERGTGKELVARALHDRSDVKGLFVVVNCAAVADSLLESELFGYERGAFTGAERQTRGKFELAQNGTLFLDEVGNMSRAFQQKILRAVEYGAFLRVGGSAEISVKTRIIAATNGDLKAKIASGEFLPDLYDRLAFEVIRVPPLRERSGDIEVLARHFLEQFMREVPSFQGKKLSQAALDCLRAYSFPGNVRELKSLIERAVYRDTTNELTPEDLDLPFEAQPRPASGSFKEQVEAFERELVRSALERAQGNQAEAARLLELPYHQFRYYLGKHGRG